MADGTGHDIFVSYRRADRELVASLARKLEARGLDVWYDAEIDASADWAGGSAAELSRSRMLVVLFSDACNESRQLTKELAVADALGRPVIPILVEDALPRGANLHELADRRWIEAWPDPAGQIDALVDHLAALAAPTVSVHAATAADQDLPGVREVDPAGPSSQVSDYVRRSRPGMAARQRLLVLLGLIVVGALAVFIVLNQVDVPQADQAGFVMTLGLATAVLIATAYVVYGLLARRRAIRAFRSNLKRP